MHDLYKTESVALMESTNPTFIKMNSTSYAKLVEVRIEFVSIGEIDTMNEKYQAEFRIRARWYDDEEIFEFDKRRHWYPKLFIENALNDVKEEFTYHVARVDDKTIITETRIAKGSFWGKLNDRIN